MRILHGDNNERNSKKIQTAVTNFPLRETPARINWYRETSNYLSAVFLNFQDLNHFLEKSFFFLTVMRMTCSFRLICMKNFSSAVFPFSFLSAAGLYVLQVLYHVVNPCNLIRPEILRLLNYFLLTQQL